MPKRLKIGDVLEIGAASGLVYVQYLGKHPEYGDAIAVCSMEHSRRPVVAPDLFRNGYVIFYPANAAVSQNLARVVGNLPAADVPTRLRRPGVRSEAGVETWIIEDESGEHVKRTLSADERQMPLAVIWNHEMLLQRISEGWRPEREGAS